MIGTCSAPTSAHDAHEPKRHILRAGAAITTHVLCRGCADRLASMGFDIFPDRRDPEAPLRRPFVVRTLRRNAA